MRPHVIRNFASHSQPLQALKAMEFWSKRTIVEDGHQYWRSLFFFDGDYTVLPIRVPIYQDAVLDETFFKTIKAGQYVLYYGIAIAYLFISKSLNMTFKSPLGIVSAIVYIIGIGFHEETIFRGLVANFIGKKYMKDLKGFYFSVAMTSVLFGLIHLVNMTRGVQLLSAVVQSLVAISLGAVFTAIYYRGGNLWALMFLHSVIDLGPLFQTLFTVNEAGAAGAINTLGIMNLIPIIPNVIALVWIMRKSKAQEALVHMRKRYETL